MAGITIPTMMSGMAKPNNWLNMPLNVRNILVMPSGITNPVATPNAIASKMRGRSPNFIFFIILKWAFIVLIIS